MTTKTFGEQIADLETTRAAKSARMSEVMQKSIDEGRTTDEAEAEEVDTITDEIKAIDADLVRLKAAEKLSVEKATPVDKKGEPREFATVKNTQKLDKGVAFARFAGSLAHAKGNLRDASEFMSKRFPEMGEQAKAFSLMSEMGIEEVTKAAVAAGTTSNATYAAPLVNYQNMVTDFIEFLRPQTIVGKIDGIRRVPFNIRVPRQTSGGAAYWVGEGAPKPVTSVAFDNISLKWTKLATIAVITEELARFSSPSAEMLIRDSLAAAIVQQMDADFVNPANAGTADVKPASITNGVTAVTATADPVADVKSLFGNFIAANSSPTNGVWIMSASTALALSLKTNANGQPQFPGMTLNGGTFQGLPVVVSQAVGNILILANAKELLLADDGQVSIDVSREASLQMSDAPDNPVTATTLFRSLWQDNLIGIRAERYVNWAKARASSVQYASGVAY